MLYKALDNSGNLVWLINHSGCLTGHETNQMSYSVPLMFWKPLSLYPSSGLYPEIIL